MNKEFEERLEQLRRKELESIEAHGYFPRGVFNSFAYTSGLASQGLPDVIVNVPPSRHIMVLLCEAAERLMAGKEGMFDRHESDCMARSDYSPLYLKLVEVPWSDLMRNEYVTQADVLYDNNPHIEVEPRRLVQLLVSDSNGVLPDEPNYHWPQATQELLYKFGEVIPLASKRH